LPLSKVKIPSPAVELLKNETPDEEPRTSVPPRRLKILLPAVELSKNETFDPWARSTVAPKRLKVAVSAVEVPKNWTWLINVCGAVPPRSVKTVPLPAVESSLNTITPWLSRCVAVTVKFCVTPELFVIPAPLTVKVTFAVVVLKLLAPGLNTKLLTSVLADREISAVFERSNIATSSGPFGMVLGVQFSAVFQSLLIGVMLQVALPAYTALSAPSESVRMMAQARMGVFTAAIMPTAPFKSKADS